MAWQAVAWLGLAWLGVVWCGVAWRGGARWMPLHIYMNKNTLNTNESTRLLTSENNFYLCYTLCAVIHVSVKLLNLYFISQSIYTKHINKVMLGLLLHTHLSPLLYTQSHKDR